VFFVYVIVIHSECVKSMSSPLMSCHSFSSNQQAARKMRKRDLLTFSSLDSSIVYLCIIQIWTTHLAVCNIDIRTFYIIKTVSDFRHCFNEL